MRIIYKTLFFQNDIRFPDKGFYFTVDEEKEAMERHETIYAYFTENIIMVTKIVVVCRAETCGYDSNGEVKACIVFHPYNIRPEKQLLKN
jgi:hypothetical protein